MVKKVFVTILSSGYSQFVGICTFLMTAKFYGVEGRGIYASVTSVATFSSALVGLSVGMVLPYFVVSSGMAREQFLKEKLVTILALVFSLSLVAALAVAVTYGLDPMLRSKLPIKYLIVVGFSFPYYMWMGSNDYLFSSAGQIVQQNRIEFLNRTGFLVLSVLLIALARLSLLAYMALYGVFNLVQMTREVRFLLRKFDVDFVVDRRLVLDIVRKGISVHPVTVASMLNTTFSVLVITYYSKNLRDVGYFNFVCQLTSMLAILPIVVNRYLLSEITAHGALAVWPKQKRIMLYCLLVTALVCVAAFFLVEPFCKIFKREFIGAVDLFRLILVMVVPSSFCILMQSQWFSSGRFRLMSATNVTVGVLGALITLVSVPKFHEFGAAATTVFTYGALFIVNLAFYLKIDRDFRAQRRELAIAALQ